MALIRAAHDRLFAVWRWIRRRLRRSPLAAIPHAEAILSDIAGRSSCPVQDVSSRLGLPLGSTIGIMSQLEKKGLVRVSKDRVETNRIVAITKMERQELRL